MKYSVRYDPKAERQLEKLPKGIASRIVMKMREVAEIGHGIESVKELNYGFKVRVGDYRILVDLTFNPSIIWVRHVDHRSRIYERD